MRWLAPQPFRRGRWRVRRWPLVLAYGALVVSCDNPLAPSVLRIGRVDVRPAAPELEVGGTQALTAQVFDEADQLVASQAVFWSSKDPTVATVDAAGIVTAVGPGVTQVAASTGGRSGIAAITVRQRPVIFVRVTPSTGSVVAHGTLQLTADPLDGSGLVLGGRTIAWSSADPTVAAVNSSGLVTGVSPGIVTIRAVSENVEGSSVLTVLPVPVASLAISPNSASLNAGESMPFVATALDDQGQTLPGRLITWGTSNAAIATVSSDGVVTGIAPGTVTITAASPGNGPDGSTPTATVQVTVLLVPVARVDVVPASASLQVGHSTNFAVNLFDATNQPLTALGRTIAWQSSDPTIATIDNATGVATGVAVGTVTLSAAVATPGQAQSVVGTATLTVSNQPVATVVVTPDPGTVHVGGIYKHQFMATTLDGQGNVLLARSVVWTSSNQALASVDASTGVVTGLATGTVQISAVSEGIQGFANVTIDLVPVANVTLQLPSPTMIPPASQQLTATPRDSAGNAVTGAALGGRATSWQSSNSSVASVNLIGQVTAVAQGTAMITATVGGTPGSAAITVLAPAGQIVIAVAPDSVIAPATLTGTVTVRDATLQPLANRPVQLSSSNPSVATVAPSSATSDASGVVSVSVTGVSAGSMVVQAASESQTGSFPIRVLNPVSAISVTTPGDSIIGTATLQATAALTDAGGTALTGRPIAWSTDAAAVATVDASGLVTGVAPGPVNITASVEGKSGTVSLRVLPPVFAVAVTAPSDSIIGTATLQATAALSDASAAPITGRPVAWTSSNPAAATVDPVTGLITGVSSGAATITATAEGVSGVLAIHVVPPGASVLVTAPTDSLIGAGTLSATATVLDASSTPVPGRPVTISSSDPLVATVSPSTATTDASGQVAITVTRVGAGSATITATSAALSGTLIVRMLNPVASVSVTSPGDSIIGTATLQATATLKDAANVTLTGRPVAWTSGTPAAATVNSATGLVTGVAPGTSIITATSEGHPGTRTVRVLPAISTVALTAAVDSLIGAGSLAATATIRDAANQPIAGRIVTLVSGNTGVATVSPASGTTNASGQVAVTITRVANGSATITATSAAIPATLNVRMLAPVNLVTVTSPGDSIIGTHTLQATATLKDAANVTLTGRPVAWTSDNAAAATVNPTTGLITGVAAGTAHITATSETKSAALTIRVLAAVSSVTLTSPGDSIIGTSTLQVTATLRDAASNILTGRPVAWSSGTPGVATVNASTGLITGVAPGTSVITALVEGVSKTHERCACWHRRSR